MTDQRRIPAWAALIPLAVLIISMAVTIIKFEGVPHIPLLISAAAASIIAVLFGFKWKHIEQSYFKGIQKAVPAIVILLLVGLIIATWIGGGVVATLIYYGLKVLSPSYFLLTTALLCAIVSVAIGSSWSTMATMGIAALGIGESMGIPAAMIAGAVVSGSYLGDKMSPLSDTTNLASGVADVPLFAHIKHMMATTIPAFAIALIIYWIMGRQFAGTGASTGQIQKTLSQLDGMFVISPWLLLVPVALIVLVLFRVPAIPALAAGIVLGFICQVTVQGADAATAFNGLFDGYAVDGKNDFLSELLNHGGLDSMMYTVSLAIVAMIFGGVMEETGMLQTLMELILKVFSSARAIVPATVVSSLATNILMAEQYISIIVPARMYTPIYRQKELDPKNLSRAVEDGGTVTAPLIPWTTGGVFITSTLGINTLAYLPYSFFNLLTPTVSIILGITGWTIVKKFNTKKDKETAEAEAV